MATSFTYSGQIIEYTVTTGGVYSIAAYGAQGGSTGVATGGLGAEIVGDFTLTAGEVLDILVGGQGTSYLAAGGGGWAQDALHPELPVLLEVLIDGKVIGTTLACDYRADLDKAKIGAGRCAFFLASPVRLRPEMLTTVEIRRASDHAMLRMSDACAEALAMPVSKSLSSLRLAS